MKKIIAFVLSLTTALFVVGCAADENVPQSTGTAKTTISSVTTTDTVPSVDTEALEAKFLGRWHCVAVMTEGSDRTEKYNNDSFKEFAYGISHQYSLVMDELAHGYIFDDVTDRIEDRVHIRFDTIGDTLEGYIRPGNFIPAYVFVWKSFDEIRASVEDGRLVLASGNAKFGSKLIFEKGESPEVVDHDKAERLATATELDIAAQCAFNCTNLTDIDPDNNIIIKKDRSPVKLKDLDKHDFIENGVYYSIIWNLKYSDKAEEYYVCWEVDEEKNKIIYAQASATLDEGYVAQYPYPYMPYRIDPDSKHMIGTKF